MWPLSLVAKLKLALGVAAAAALVFGYLHLKHKWTEEGYNNGKADTEVASAKVLKDIQKQTQDRLDEQKQIFDAQQKIIDASRAREGVIVTALQNLSAQRQVAQQAVAAIPDAQQKADLESKLGGPLESLPIIRHANEIVTDYPLVKDSLKKTQALVVEAQTQSAAKDAQIQSEQAKVGIAIGQANTILGFYTQAMDALNRPKRRVYCLWLCKTKDKLSLPDPLTLKPAATPTKP